MRSFPRLVFLGVLCAICVRGVAQSVSFPTRALTVNEGDGTVDIVLTRSSPTERVAVWCETAERSARAGMDFSRAADSVVFAAGVSRAVFPVQILDNYVRDSTRTMVITLSAQRGMPAIDSVVVRIEDNDGAGESALTAAPVSVDFGDVNIGIMASREITVTSSAAHEVRFGIPTVPQGAEDGYQCAFQPSIMILGAHGSTQLAVGFNPPPGSAGKVSAGTVMFHSGSGSVSVHATGRSIDTIPPRIAFGAFRAHDTVVAGSVVPLALLVTDNDSVADALVEYVIDNGRGHGDVIHAQSEIRGVQWHVPEQLQSEHCTLRVQARDRLGNTASLVSPSFVVRQKK